MSGRDAAVRALLGTVLAIFAMDALVLWTGPTRWITGAVLVSVSALLIMTASLRVCPLYLLFDRRSLPA